MLNQDGNPERVSQSAHSMREVLEKLTREVGAKTWASSYLNTIGVELDAARERSKCFDKTAQTWSGEIDSALQQLLAEVTDYVAKHRANPSNSAVEKEFLRGLEPPTEPLPEDRLNALAREWRDFSKYFQDVAHHNESPTVEEFTRRLDDCTRFLLSRLRLTAYGTRQALDDIIAEAEADA